MSVREEDKQKSCSTGRGLGLAAAAVGVGVGVGAALYYLFSNRQEENPHGEGSSAAQEAREWHIREQEALPSSDSESEYSGSDDAVSNENFVSSDDTSYGSNESSIPSEIFQESAPRRQRSWSLEECSVCCDVMLASEGMLTMLPCGHKFHEKCVRPWLHDHQTCPNCRKAA